MMAALVCAAVTSLPPGPLDFKAESMRMEPKEHRVHLDGDVHIWRGDLTVTGDHAVADVAERPAAPTPAKKGKKASVAGQGLEKFVVDGKVHVQRGTRTADGEHGELDVRAQTLVLTGTEAAPPVLRDGTETLVGEQILLHLDSEDVEVLRPRITLKRSLPDEKKGQTVRVEAQRLSLDKSAKLARFVDGVVVRRGDATVRSPRMDARYDDQGELTRLELRGGVDLRQGDRRATGRSADYDAQGKSLVLTGDPRLYDRGDVLSGDRIDLALDSHEVKVAHVRARLHPEAHKDEAAP